MTRPSMPQLESLSPMLTVELATSLATTALDAVDREFPNVLVHVLAEPAGGLRPRLEHPVFYGCYDWHSAVHSHWALVRLARCVPEGPWVGAVRRRFAEHFTPERIAGEVAYFEGPGRSGFERPYGLAWVLQLALDLHPWSATTAAALAPLAGLASERLLTWLERLAWPIRCGEHSQTAFAMSLAFEWARVHAPGAADRIAARAVALYGGDRDAPVDYEPSAHDFLSPALAEADLMARVLEPVAFRTWFDAFLPTLDSASTGRWLCPVRSVDRTDGKLVHFDGLNLSRSWMLRRVGDALDEADPRRGALWLAASEHLRVGLDALIDAHYVGSHWLPSFAVAAMTGLGTWSGPRG